MKPEQRILVDAMLAALAEVEAGPTEDDLAHAPILNCWCPLFSSYSTPGIVGNCNWPSAPV